MAIRDFQELVSRAKLSKHPVVAVAGFDEEVAGAMKLARRELGAYFKVFDWRAESGEAHTDGIEISMVESPEQAAYYAAKCVSDGEAALLMKGFVSTSTFLRAVLDKSLTLRTNRLMSHLAIFQLPTYHKLIAVTDGGMVIAPDITQKVQILNNAILFFEGLGYEQIKVAVLCAEERPNASMPCTTDAANLKTMGDRGQFGKHVIVDGPLAFDLAFSQIAAKVKGVASEVCGDADILLVPDIEAGNLLGKSFTYVAGGKMAGLVVGARCPVVLPSRADTEENKFYSLAAGLAFAGGAE